MKLLSDFIDKHYEGNITKFAETYGETRQQIQRHIKRGAYIQAGEIYVKPTKHGEGK